MVDSASSAEVSAPPRLPCPTSRDSALRRACFSCNAVRTARRSLSFATISGDAAARPRRARAASKAVGSARMARMSCMVSPTGQLSSMRYTGITEASQRARKPRILTAKNAKHANIASARISHWHDDTFALPPLTPFDAPAHSRFLRFLRLKNLLLHTSPKPQQAWAPPSSPQRSKSRTTRSAVSPTRSA